MPKISLFAKKNEKEGPEIELNNLKFQDVSGTLSIWSVYNESVDSFNRQVEVLESLALENPTLSEHIWPAIREINKTKNFVYFTIQQLVSSKKPELEPYKKIIEEYKLLITKKGIKEKEIQSFFKNRPMAKSLIHRAVKVLIPQKSFGGERFPDFVAILHTGEHVLIELEKPTNKLYKKNGTPTVKFTQAEQQIQDYLGWVAEDKDYLQKRELPNISVENTRGLLIIGMKNILTEKEIKKLERKRYGLRDYEIKTFDEILLENQEHLNAISKT